MCEHHVITAEPRGGK